MSASGHGRSLLNEMCLTNWHEGRRVDGSVDSESGGHLGSGKSYAEAISSLRSTDWNGAIKYVSGENQESSAIRSCCHILLGSYERVINS